mgnify:CR=1 FL=1
MDKSIYQSDFLKGLTEREVEEILENTRFHLKKYRQGDYIAFSGQSSESLNIITHGSVKGEMVDFRGNVVKVEDIFAPDAFAPAFLFASDNTLLIDVVANTDVEVMFIFKEDLLKLFQQNQQVLQNYMRIISDKFVLMTNKMKFLSLKTIKGKIAHYLLSREKRKAQNKQLRFHKSQEQLAEYFGVTRPSLSRELKSMEKAGIIALERKDIRILDKESLKQFLD